ncbi:MAG: phosphatidate cytidylyltransferase [Limnochordaceae bacterium]|nr:phosphatidate cytidylyltransferase [Limnochordaceae bacterium]
MFARRAVTAAAGAPILLVALYAGGVWWALTLAIIAVWGSLELGDLFVAKGAGQPQRDVLILAGLAGVLLAPAMQHLAGTHWPRTLPLLLPTLVLGYAALRAWLRGASVLLEAAAAAFAFSYVGVLMGFWWLLRSHPDLGWPYAMVVMVGTWATDIGAFAVGRLMGRHRLLPRVSPGKTWEGAIGGAVVGCAVVVWLGGKVAQMAGWMPVGLGAVTTVAAQLGDLAESALKRDANVKDSGWLLPGHGGILDRMDSVLTSGLAAYLFAILMARL